MKEVSSLYGISFSQKKGNKMATKRSRKSPGEMTITSRERLEKTKRFYADLRRKGLCDTSEDAENQPTTSWPRNVARRIASISQQPHTSYESSTESPSTSQTSTVNVKPKAARKLSSSSSESDETEPKSEPKNAHCSDDFEKSKPTQKSHLGAPAKSSEVRISDKKAAMTKQQINSFTNIIGDVAKNVKKIQGELKTETENLRQRCARGLKRLPDVPRIFHKFHEMMKKYESRLAEERQNFMESYKDFCSDLNSQEATPIRKDSCPEENIQCIEKVQKSPRSNKSDFSISDYGGKTSNPNNGQEKKSNGFHENGISVDEDQGRKSDAETDETEKSAILCSGSSTDVPEGRPVKRRKTAEFVSSSIQTIKTDNDETDRDEPTVFSSNSRPDEIPKQMKDGTMPEIQKITENVPEVLNIASNDDEECAIEVDESDNSDSSTYYIERQEAESETMLEDVEIELNSDESAKMELLNSESSDDELRNGSEIKSFSDASSSSFVSKRNRRRKFRTRNNPFYWNDEKLRQTCVVELERLNKKELEKHSWELRKSKEFLEDKMLKRLLSLDNIVPRKRRVRNRISSDSSDGERKIPRCKTPKTQETNENVVADFSTAGEDSIDDSLPPNFRNQNGRKIMSKDELFEQAYKSMMLNNDSYDSDQTQFSGFDEGESIEEEAQEKMKKSATKKRNTSDEETKEEKAARKEKSKWKRDKLLTGKISDSSDDSDSEKELRNLEKRNEIDSCESSIDFLKQETEPILGPQNSQGSIKMEFKMERLDSFSDNEVTVINSQESQAKGRKNIRRLLDDQQVAADTRQAVIEEEERRKRIAEKQLLFSETFDSQSTEENEDDKLILDFDKDTKKELVRVNGVFVRQMKLHQMEGVKFMWDACFESLERAKNSQGSGCILAHCMGLGKTFAVIALVHTLLNCKDTGIKTVMILCPLSIISNWINEFNKWLKFVKGDKLKFYEFTTASSMSHRYEMLKNWQSTGGVLVIGYELYRNLSSRGTKIKESIEESMISCLVDPGPDLVICDEGHVIKNEETALNKTLRKIHTRRRIVLTGTPLQNNLMEYHCMMQFVKPNLLGSKSEFTNRFVNPINNGQCKDSTPQDVKLMQKRAHVLHKMLQGCVQRRDDSILASYLPSKQEYVIFVKLTDVQIKMYKHYLSNLTGRNGIFEVYYDLERILTHPLAMRMAADKKKKDEEKEALKALRNSKNRDVGNSDDTRDPPLVQLEAPRPDDPHVRWWEEFTRPEDYESIEVSSKLLLLFMIITECEEIGEKLLVFSHILDYLTIIEKFLKRMKNWKLGSDYFRFDGNTTLQKRSDWCEMFNKETNTKARLFLISTRAGGLGINLTGANRVIIFDTSWNPSDDVQSVHRIYRFGQKKACYVYRFVGFGTMEEKIYNRQVTKLSLACRVVDEQQIERHYGTHDLAELYSFQEPPEDNEAVLNCPKDRLLAKVVSKCKSVIVNIQEHESLFKNKQEEELSEKERQTAWKEYEDEKSGKNLETPQNEDRNGSDYNHPNVSKTCYNYAQYCQNNVPEYQEAVPSTSTNDVPGVSNIGLLNLMVAAMPGSVPITQANKIAVAEPERRSTTDQQALDPEQAIQGQVPAANAQPGKLAAVTNPRNLVKQLLQIVLHAVQCTKHPGTCSVSSCLASKHALKHFKSCQIGKDCTVKYCKTFKNSITHWAHCAIRNCNLCSPLEEDDKYQIRNLVADSG